MRSLLRFGRPDIADQVRSLIARWVCWLREKPADLHEHLEPMLDELHDVEVFDIEIYARFLDCYVRIGLKADRELIARHDRWRPVEGTGVIVSKWALSPDGFYAADKVTVRSNR